jgi:hypothetical protein
MSEEVKIISMTLATEGGAKGLEVIEETVRQKSRFINIEKVKEEKKELKATMDAYVVETQAKIATLTALIDEYNRLKGV